MENARDESTGGKSTLPDFLGRNKLRGRDPTL
jgi:hypothetical protein